VSPYLDKFKTFDDAELEYLTEVANAWKVRGMGIFDRLKRMTAENDADLWGEWCARTMIIAFKVKMEEHRSTQPTGAFIAREALLARKKWKAKGTDAVSFTETGEVVETGSDFNLRQSIHKAIDVEYGYELRNRSAFERIEMLQLCHNGAERFLNK
jgi:hypothetical protein